MSVHYLFSDRENRLNSDDRKMISDDILLSSILPAYLEGRNAHRLDRGRRRQAMYNRVELITKRPPSLSNIRWNDQRRGISVGCWSISLTPLEYQILASLRHGNAIKYTRLAKHVYHCSMDKKIRELIDKHVDNIRGKLLGLGFSIYCIHGYGYILLPDDNWEA